MSRLRPRGQRGVALLTAIILVALATMLAVAIAFHTAMTARRGASSFTVEQGLQFGAGAEVVAGYALMQDLRQTPKIDRDGDEWTRPIPPTEVAPEITFEAVLTDESGKFNLNTLVDPATGETDANSLRLFEALLQQLGIEIKWAGMMADFIDPGPLQNANGAEDGVYTSLHPAHRAANTPITSVSELMSLPGFGRENYLRLLPHVTALPPEERAINVCFASAELLDALESAFTGSFTQSYTKRDAKEFADLKRGQCATLATTIQGTIPQDATPEAQRAWKDRTGNVSNYFRLHTWVTIGTTRFALYSLMARKVNQVRVVGRSFGTE